MFSGTSGGRSLKNWELNISAECLNLEIRGEVFKVGPLAPGYREIGLQITGDLVLGPT